MEKLVAADVNEAFDVYEYEGEGQSARFNLLSSGTSELPSYFYDATPSGSDAFIVTDQSLVRSDTSTYYVVYDVRDGGGFSSQSEGIQPPSCDAIEACRSPLSEPPAELLASSATLVGAGNLAVAPQTSAQNQRLVKKRVTKLTRKQQLERALHACAKRYRHDAKRRARCERRARTSYGVRTKRAGK